MVSLGIIYTHANVKEHLIKKLAKKDLDYQKICDMEVRVILGVNHPLAKSKKALGLKELAPYGWVSYA